MRKPLVVELFVGRFGWGKGFVAQGWRVVGFDILHEPYHGPVPEGCSLALQDVLTLHGSQLRDARALVCSPPCQEYSHMAMPFTIGKNRAKEYRDGTRDVADLTRLFDACFRLQREASEAAGRYIPMVVENVKGAQPWVGRAKAHYGSFYLWGDVDSVGGRIVARGARFGDTLAPAPRYKGLGGSWFAESHNVNGGGGNPVDGTGIVKGWDEVDGVKCHGQKNGEEYAMTRGPVGRKVPGFNFHEYEKTGQPGRSFQSAAVTGVKVGDIGWNGSGPSLGFNVTAAQRHREGIKQGGSGRAWFDEAVDQRRREASAALKGGGGGWFEGNADSKMRQGTSKGAARKAASAAIAEIPPALAAYFARIWHPDYAGTPQRTISAATADCATVEAGAP